MESILVYMQKYIFYFKNTNLQVNIFKFNSLREDKLFYILIILKHLNHKAVFQRFPELSTVK